MGMNQADTISILNRLIETLKDGQHGFHVAAQDVKDSGLKTLFEKFSLQRSQFAGELQQEAVRLGEKEPEETSSVAGALHRGWINLKAALAGGDEHALLSECERGEDSAVSTFQEALEKALPENIREIVDRQYRAVKAAHDQVRDLREARVK
jgi:uncharacterized protein (TIGR02284 family)